MKWMYCFTPAIEYAGSDHDTVQNLSGGMLRVAFRLSVPATAGYLALLTLQHIIPLLFIYRLSTQIGAQGAVRFSVAEGLTLLGLGFCSFFLIIGQLNLERWFSLKLCGMFERRLSACERQDLPLASMERLAARDLGIVLDGTGASLGLFAIPLFLLLATLGAWVVYGASGLLVLGFIAVFIPVSYGLSRLSDRNYERVMEKHGERIEQCSRWLKEGPLRKQFPDPPLLNSIRTTLAEELRLRNRDTLLRGADSYIVGFGRLIPFVLLAAFGMSTSLWPWQGAVLWLAIPLLHAMLGLPRAYLGYRAVGRSLNELNQLFTEPDSKLDVSFDEQGDVLFDENWPIWPSSLLGLIPGARDSDQPLIAELLSAFRLIPELEREAPLAMARFIEMDAENLSNGQRLRLQILRGVFLSRALNRGLLIDNDLSALDSDSLSSVTEALGKLEGVRFSPSAIQAIGCRRPNTGKNYPVGAPKLAEEMPVGTKPFDWRAFLHGAIAGWLALLIPAAMMSYAGNVTLSMQYWGAGWVVFYIIAGIAIGVGAGLFLESSLRNRLARAVMRGMEDVREGDPVNKLQVVSRDVTTGFERIAWYTHDIVWIGALLACSVAALGFGFGLFGLLLAAGFAVMLAGLYRLSIGELYRTRMATVAGFDALLGSARASHVISSALASSLSDLPGWLAAVRQKSAVEGVAHFYRSRMHSVIARTVTAAGCTLLSDLVIVLMVFLGAIHQTSEAHFVLAVTALLLVRSDLANVFLAITGYKSQIISVERLLHFSAPKNRVLLQDDGLFIRVDGFTGRRIYLAQTLIKGSVQILKGASGAGKSDYLKGVGAVVDITGASARHETLGHAFRTWYIDAWTLKEILGAGDSAEELMEWLKTLPGDGRQLVLLDEAFLQLSLPDCVAMTDRLEEYCAVSGNTLVLVDHRLEHERSIDVAEFAQ
ncbi:hypothetical protein DLD99_13420 [Pseudomonas kribbensis]|uniref:Uncharacterized protein n=1 Tax=Pseudomonas kribbensis TaxID=1628086 RepID=A0A345RQ61_9PSED|nr:hypothetical protein [Pseudomonas kribbensis]AXI61427.1 hypothetical protein DLD99_13420 [Pseudomonas kribbensis]